MERVVRAIALLLAVMFPGAAGSAQGKGDVEYGLGYLDAAVAQPDSLTFYRSPSLGSGALAFLQSNRVRYAGQLQWLSAYPLCIEVIPREAYGLPILGFSPDSQWVKVSLDCRVLHNPPVGWVWRVSPHLRATLWGGSWQAGCPLHFRESVSETFFEAAYGRPVAVRKILPEFNPSDYCMRLLEIQGRWMKVLIQTPTPPLGEDDEVPLTGAVKTYQVEAWIQFLDESGRPRVWPIYDE